jgi:hypothetical protein
MAKLNLNSLSLREFVSQVKTNEEVMAAKEILRYVQRASFNMLWNRCDSSTTRIYASIGQAARAMFRPTDNFKTVRDRVAEKPVVGYLRTTTNIHDDIRFVLLVSGKQLFLVLDNNAADARIQQLWVYDTDEDAECFVEYRTIEPEVDLMGFLMSRSLHI